LKLVEPCQRPLARALHEIVAVVQRARQAVGEPSQARQEADDLGSQFLGHPDLPPPFLHRQRALGALIPREDWRFEVKSR
jgi:hypothetical protein